MSSQEETSTQTTGTCQMTTQWAGSQPSTSRGQRPQEKPKAAAALLMDILQDWERTEVCCLSPGRGVLPWPPFPMPQQHSSLGSAFWPQEAKQRNQQINPGQGMAALVAESSS